MYRMLGSEFSELVNRSFTEYPGSRIHAKKNDDKFVCRTTSNWCQHYDILRFEGTFHTDVGVSAFNDFSHVSFHYQLKGRSNATISGLNHDVPLAAGEYNVLNCVEPVSSYDFPKQHDYAYVCVGVSPEYVVKMLRACGLEWNMTAHNITQQLPFALLKNGKRFNRFINHALSEIRYPSVAESMKLPYVASKIDELMLLTLSDARQLAQATEEPLINKKDLEKLNAVKAFLDKHFLAAHSLQGLARESMLNEFKLKRGFRTVFGTSVFGYIHQLRMNHAFGLLQTKELSIGEVASLIGYACDSSFSRAFKNHFGEKPSELKREKNKQYFLG